MRIKSGRSQTAARAQSSARAGKAKKSSGAKFQEMVGQEDDTQERARQIRNQLLEELSSLAQEVEKGQVSKEEASRKFAVMVIKERFGDKNAGKGAKNMQEAISDMVESDPNFVSRLHTQLKKMSKD